MTFQPTETKTDSSSFSSAPTAVQSTSSTNESSPYQLAFAQIVSAIGHEVGKQTNTHFTVSLIGEDSQFTRFSQAKVRQTGHVRDGRIKLTLMSSFNNTDAHTVTMSLPFTGDFAIDWAVAQPAIAQLQQELPQLPIDPYVVLPTAAEGNQKENNLVHRVKTNHLLAESEVATALLAPISSTSNGTSKSPDFSGLYAGGRAYRAYADSAGKHHWFETPSFTLDYSLFGSSKQQAVKGTLAGDRWDEQQYVQNIAAAKQELELLARPVKAVPKGSYRTYLAPAAVADIIDTIIWGGGLGEASLRQGNSAFSKLEKGEARLSERFSLQEDFERISIPRFNGGGVIAPNKLPLIERGQWANSLVSGRSEKEYGKPSNGANEEEIMRAPAVAPGTLKATDILAELGTGLYLSNLHYLNWSDLTAGRITGMTRYACFWVEDGEIVAPIENLRFDDDLYRFLGEGLIGLTDEQTFVPEVGTYDNRSLGGMWMPGMLIDQFRYTL